MGGASDFDLSLSAREPRLRSASVIFHLRVKRSYGQALALGIPARRVNVNYSASPVRRMAATIQRKGSHRMEARWPRRGQRRGWADPNPWRHGTALLDRRKGEQLCNPCGL